MSTVSNLKMPNLRFKDDQGKDYPNWETKYLADIGSVKGGKRLPKGFTLEQRDNGFPYITVSSMKNGTVELDEIKYVPMEVVDRIQNYRISKSDIFVSVAGTLGLVGIVPKELDGANLTENANKLTNIKCNQVFLYQYLLTKKFQELVTTAKTTSAQPKLAMYALSKFCVSLPSGQEQHKIANFLSSIDTRVEQLEKKKSLFEQYRKGLMQKLFSQEIRFKDDHGEKFPDWAKESFSHLYCFKSTNSFSRRKMNYSFGTVRNIHYGDIHTKFRAQFELKRESVPFLNSDVDINNISDDKLCKEGDLVIADASEDYIGIGKTIELLSLENNRVLAGLHTLLARLNSDQIYVGFSAYMMNCWFVRQQIMKIAQGTKVLGISMGRLCRVELPLPSREEQQKITDFLASLDRKIDLISNQIDETRQFKKGLLQQMFV